ncbi:MAG: MBL fold metallo-hydrolase [Janthinobacterium lividum]
MAVRIDEIGFSEPLATRLSATRGEGAVVLHWLGQAGFVISAEGRRIVVDPYLSDSLATKYRNSPTPHDRMLPPPTTVEGLGPVVLVLVTHQHTDHMDPGTLAPLAAANPTARFIVPAASLDEAWRRADAGPDRFDSVDAGDVVEPWPGFRVSVVRAAHETLELDANGRHRFLGYVLSVALRGGTVTLFHSGDTVPFDGQIGEVARFRPDVALLPVNGRSAALLARGVPGNLTLDEAVSLGESVGAGWVVAHHHGLFAFNTCDPALLAARARDRTSAPRLVPAQIGVELSLRPA